MLFHNLRSLPPTNILNLKKCPLKQRESQLCLTSSSALVMLSWWLWLSSTKLRWGTRFLWRVTPAERHEGVWSVTFWSIHEQNRGWCIRRIAQCNLIYEMYISHIVLANLLRRYVFIYKYICRNQKYMSFCLLYEKLIIRFRRSAMVRWGWALAPPRRRCITC